MTVIRHRPWATHSVGALGETSTGLTHPTEALSALSRCALLHPAVTWLQAGAEAGRFLGF